MFKIQKSSDANSVVFMVSGRIEAAGLAELKKLVESEASDHSLTLDLAEVKLVDRDVIGFLAGCEAKGVKLVNCPAYIREWIERETTP
jgi:anti-anti-sigma regulatory factor